MVGHCSCLCGVVIVDASFMSKPHNAATFAPDNVVDGTIGLSPGMFIVFTHHTERRTTLHILSSRGVCSRCGVFLWEECIMGAGGRARAG